MRALVLRASPCHFEPLERKRAVNIPIAFAGSGDTSTSDPKGSRKNKGAVLSPISSLQLTIHTSAQRVRDKRAVPPSPVGYTAREM
jgi:hypothetical protein